MLSCPATWPSFPSHSDRIKELSQLCWPRLRLRSSGQIIFLNMLLHEPQWYNVCVLLEHLSQMCTRGVGMKSYKGKALGLGRPGPSPTCHPHFFAGWPQIGHAVICALFGLPIKRGMSTHLLGPLRGWSSKSQLLLSVYCAPGTLGSVLQALAYLIIIGLQDSHNLCLHCTLKETGIKTQEDSRDTVSGRQGQNANSDRQSLASCLDPTLNSIRGKWGNMHARAM